MQTQITTSLDKKIISIYQHVEESDSQVYILVNNFVIML